MDNHKWGYWERTSHSLSPTYRTQRSNRVSSFQPLQLPVHCERRVRSCSLVPVSLWVLTASLPQGRLRQWFPSLTTTSVSTQSHTPPTWWESLSHACCLPLTTSTISTTQSSFPLRLPKNHKWSHRSPQLRLHSQLVHSALPFKSSSWEMLMRPGPGYGRSFSWKVLHRDNSLRLFSRTWSFHIWSQSTQLQNAFLTSPLEGHFLLLLHVHQASCLCHLFNSLTIWYYLFSKVKYGGLVLDILKKVEQHSPMLYWCYITRQGFLNASPFKEYLW